MIHKGNILEEVVRNTDKVDNLASLAKKLGYSRSTLYSHFKDPDLKDGIILKYAKTMEYYFEKEFPDLYTKATGSNYAFKHGKATDSLEDQVESWRYLYYQQLVENNQLLKELLKERAK
jgi:hypothetical protein